MSYRGEDLDLRTPQTWSAPAEPAITVEPYPNGSRVRSYPRTAPILVDDVVLACSNHAFDVAVAHRASEVRLEHLLHAMTRIDGASHALEGRGIRVAGLRRESATVIAGEIPIGIGAGQGRPRRSDDFEQALRTASSIAYRRNAPANIDDLLDALLDMPSDIHGIALLARHGGRVARDRPQREPMRERAPLPPLPSFTRTSTSYGSDMREADVRKSSNYYTPADVTRDLRPLPADLVGTQVDGIQNARIDQLENAVRTLTSELTNERTIVSGVVQDLQRTIKAERDDTSRFRGGLHERLQSLEQTLTSANGDDRNDRLEQRISELARPWSVLSDRLQALEQTILEARDTGGDVSGLHDRIAGVERAVRDISLEGNRSTGGLADRLKGLERALDMLNAKGVDLSPIANRLDIIEEAVLSGGNGGGSDQLAERLRTLEDQIKALAGGNERLQSFVSDRMATLASGLERQRTDMAAPLAERINTFATALDGRLQSFAGLVERQRSELAQPIIERVNGVAAAIDARGNESARTLGALTERMAALDTQLSLASQKTAERITTLETQLALSMQKTAEAQAAHAAELKEVHDALIKLNTNQHTLAGSIDQWRLDGVGDISVIANRLDGIEKSSGKPLAMIEALTTSVDNINRATVERYHRRNRFWYWLFGTDDWLTASWPSQVASVEAERATLRGTPAKVTPAANGTRPQPR